MPNKTMDLTRFQIQITTASSRRESWEWPTMLALEPSTNESPGSPIATANPFLQNPKTTEQIQLLPSPHLGRTQGVPTKTRTYEYKSTNILWPLVWLLLLLAGGRTQPTCQVRPRKTERDVYDTYILSLARCCSPSATPLVVLLVVAAGSEPR